MAGARLLAIFSLWVVAVWWLGAGPIFAAATETAVATDQAFPAVAFDGSNYMVVWQDGRTGTYPDIYGARVTTSGVLLDPGGIAISTASNIQSAAAIAFDGNNYMVVWQDYRSGSNYRIYGARVTKYGIVLDPGGIVICTAAGSQTTPAISFDGTNYFIVWQDIRGSYVDIYGARVSTAGTVLDPDGIAISTSLNLQGYPAVAFDGTNYLVAWQDERNSTLYDVYGARVSTSGVVLDASGIAISTAAKRQGFPAVAFDGTNYMVVWQDDRNGFYDIRGARVSKAGAVLDAGSIAISTASNDQNYPAMTFDGTDYMVVWQDYRASSYDVYGARVSTSGALLDSTGIAVSTADSSQLAPAIAFDGTNCFTVWQDRRTGSYDIYGARVSPSGVVLDPAGLTSVVFASASASVENGCVKLFWQTSVDVSGSSFLIKRAELPGEKFNVVTARVLSPSPLSFYSVDCDVSPGRSYWYQIVLVSPSGEESYGPIQVTVENAPVAYRAYQSHPNPFNPVCTIRYELPSSGRVNLQVFDVSGSPVRTLVDGWRAAGVYDEVWDGRRDDGGALPSGVYFYVIKAGEFRATRKMVLLH